jgi:adenylylsulfate kinase-like enzyme
MNNAGLTVIAAFISPYRSDRATAAAIVGAGNFIEVHVSTPLAVCEARDVRVCMRRRARDGSRSLRAFPRPTKHRWTRR